MDRDVIIEYLKKFSVCKPYVNAMWLEGADGLKRVDEYSDIDFWFDVEKEYCLSFLNECIAELEKLSEIDSRCDMIRKEIAQSNIHLKDTSEYLTLDICVQSHEIRGLGVTAFAYNDIAELPLVIFDKKEIISFFEYKINNDEIRQVLAENKNRLLQMSRVVKYIKRGQFLETYMKYIENVAEPLVRTARLVYTPRHYDYGLCHISQHLPEEVVKELEGFYKVNDFGDIEANLDRAMRVFEKYEERLSGCIDNVF